MNGRLVPFTTFPEAADMESCLKRHTNWRPSNLVHNFINTLTYYLRERHRSFILGGTPTGAANYAKDKPVHNKVVRSRGTRAAPSDTPIYVAVLCCAARHNDSPRRRGMGEQGDRSPSAHAERGCEYVAKTLL